MTGKTRKCTDREHSHLVMAASTKASTPMTRKTDMANLSGPMGDHIRATGRMGNNTGKVYSRRPMVSKRVVSGSKEK